MGNLILRKGGKLFSTNWEYNDETEEGGYVDKDVSKEFLRHLFGGCKIEEGVTLRDLAKLMDQVPREMLLLVFSDWVDEYIDLILKSTKPVPEHVKSIELYWHMATDKEYTFQFPECHILGMPTNAKDLYGEWHPTDEIVQKPAYGIMGHTADEYADAPITVVSKTEFCNSDFPGEGEVELTTDMGYTLGHIIKGTFWELSFSGSPKMTKTFFGELKERAKDAHQMIEKLEDKK